ncbi:hypothetical protein NKI46_29545 [Mesorhizobium sp. M0615]
MLHIKLCADVHDAVVIAIAFAIPGKDSSFRLRLHDQPAIARWMLI